MLDHVFVVIEDNVGFDGDVVIVVAQVGEVSEVGANVLEFFGELADCHGVASEVARDDSDGLHWDVLKAKEEVN